MYSGSMFNGISLSIIQCFGIKDTGFKDARVKGRADRFVRLFFFFFPIVFSEYSVFLKT